jgi:hypothetical protein
VLHNEIVAGDLTTYIGGTDHDWLPPDQADIVMAVKLRCLETGLLVREYLTLTVGGEPHDYGIICYPNVGEHSKAAESITCLIADLTERNYWLRAHPPSPQLIRERFSTEAMPLERAPPLTEGYRLGDLLTEMRVGEAAGPETHEETVGPPRSITIWACGMDLRVTEILYTDETLDFVPYVGTNAYDWTSRDEAEPLMALKRQVRDSGVYARQKMAYGWGHARASAT